MLCRFAWLAPAAFASVGLLALAAHGGSAGTAVVAQKGRDNVATCAKIDGALLQRGKDNQFKALKAGDAIPPHTLLVGFPEASLVSSCGKVKIDLHVYLGDALPVTEAAIILNDSPELNADITLDRGVIELKGIGDKGNTLIRVRAGDQKWLLALKDPETTVLVARFGRHEPGVKLSKKNIDAPMMHFGFLVLKGSLSVEAGDNTYALTAPPGPAKFTYDSGHGYQILRLDSIPDEVRKLDAQEAKNFKEVCDLTGKLSSGDLGKGLDQLVGGDSLVKRRVAVACMGALDDLPRLVAALENTKHRDVREQAILVLRNWIGRQPGQLTKLSEYLVKDQKLKPAQARTVALLLKGFDDDDRSDPTTYHLLIEALEFAALPIRELAHWHLERLAPAGAHIAYDAAADDAARHKAADAWRALVPEGKLPPAPKK